MPAYAEYNTNIAQSSKTPASPAWPNYRLAFAARMWLRSPRRAQDVTFDLKPPGVVITLGNTTQFVTPRTISLRRASRHLAICTKERREHQHIMFKHEFFVSPR